MNVIPIVFSFDDNLLLPAAVCLSSLLSNSYNSTFYDIYILHDDHAKYPNEKYLEKLHLRHVNFKITYINVGNPFPNAYEIRGVTIATYYRLLIPVLIPQYDKIMYHDVDVIFRSDLSDIFFKTDLKGFYVAGVISTSFLNKNVFSKRVSQGFVPKDYVIAGNLIINSGLMRRDNLVKIFQEEVQNNNYEYQDQDILNKVCKGQIKKLPACFGGSIGHFELLNRYVDQDVFTRDELNEMNLDGVIHYNGIKPWKYFCLNFDVWWEYYRKSVFYDSKFYYSFYKDKSNYLDSLTLWKRLKIVARFFKTGGKIK